MTDNIRKEAIHASKLDPSQDCLLSGFPSTHLPSSHLVSCNPKEKSTCAGPILRKAQIKQAGIKCRFETCKCRLCDEELTSREAVKVCESRPPQHLSTCVSVSNYWMALRKRMGNVSPQMRVEKRQKDDNVGAFVAAFFGDISHFNKYRV